MTPATPLRLVMMGTGTFAEPTLNALLLGSDPVVAVFTQPDRDQGTRRGSTRQVGRGMKEIATAAGIPVFQPENINTPAGVAMLQQVQPDLLVVAAYGQILSREVLAVPTCGAINVHASLLPKYRGAAPVAWAIYHGETQSGVTIIRMSTGLDAGEMLAQEAIDILPDETSGELEARLSTLGARMAVETIARMKSGPLSGVQQNKALVTKAPKLRKENGLIDWSQSAAQVCRQVRAMQPWPTPYTFFLRDGKEPARILILRSRPSDKRMPFLSPGTIVVPPERSSVLEVVAGQGEVVEIHEVQPAGKRRMPCSEFLRGYPIKEGDRFGAETNTEA